MPSLFSSVIVCVLALAGLATAAHAQPTPLSTAFTYQGELASAGIPASGVYDVRFRLYDGASGNAQIGGTLCSDNLAVSAGRFGVSLDFGGVFAGQRRFLEIEVRSDTGLGCDDATGYTVLSPRQELTAAPNAAFALVAGNALNAATLGGQPAAFFNNAANLTGTLASARLSGTYTGPLVLNNASNLFTGNGAGITNLSATNISAGVLDAARMPTNWAAGGDLSGLFPSPTIRAGSVTRSKLDAEVNSVLGIPGSDLATAWESSSTLAASVGTAAQPRSIALAGSYAYVVCAANRLQVYDVGDPFAPQVVANVSAQAATSVYVAVYGSHAYVLCYEQKKLQVFDISNPAAPTLVASMNTTAQPRGIAFSASYAYVVEQGQNLIEVFNISVPSSPVLVAVGVIGANPYSIAVSGSYAYVTSFNTNQLEVYSLSNPVSPVRIRSVGTGAGPVCVAVSGSYAYVANFSDGSMQVFSISDPGTPVQVATMPTDIQPTCIVASGLYAYVTCGGSDTMQVFNVSNPAAPVLAAVAATGDNPVAVAVSTGGAFVLSQFSNSLQVFQGATTASFNFGLTSFSGTVNASTLSAGSIVGSGVGLTNLNASNITSGVLSVAQVPNLDASKITSGVFANARTTGSAGSSPSTLVLRDASGNFSAGIITAALSGNATSATTAANATTATTATNATLLNGQPASFYLSASNITTGTLADGMLSGNISRLNVNNTFAGDTQTFAGRIRVNNGVIQKGGSIFPGADLGLYTFTAGEWMRFATNNGAFSWFSDNGTNPGGLNPRMQLTSAGNLSVVGSLSKGGGSFKIDHPLDPEHKYLYHSFVESPDMMNIYNGNITTDGNGYATITLPDYFEALNRDFRYQLTVINEADTGEFLWAQVVKKVSGNQFTLRTSRGNLEVSWQVTGIRQDAWAQKNRIPNSVDKPAAEKGKLLHPEAFEKTAENGQVPSTPSKGAKVENKPAASSD